ncbi:MAG: transposase [Oscillospiraceae bacterium]|nr:transposase [Oscillospiraceae bacterium]
MDLPQRKQTRLQFYDYSTPGAYFITICTHEKKCLLSQIIPVGEGLAPPETKLSALGQIVKKQILSLPSRYTTVSVDNYVIMPNHVHLLISLSSGGISGGASPSPTVIDAVRTMKSISALQCSKQFGVKPLWQRSFHEHVVRNENDYREIWNYIDQNPARWKEDRYAL